MIKQGDEIPNIDLMNMTSDGPGGVNLHEFCAGRKVVIFGLPGAYTPTCSAKHLPGFIEKAKEFAGKGVDEIACVSVNDPFVMAAWGRDNSADENVTMLADGNAAFAEATGLIFDGSAFGMGKRMQRCAMCIDDKIVTVLEVEEPGAFKVSSAEHMLAQV